MDRTVEEKWGEFEAEELDDLATILDAARLTFVASLQKDTETGRRGNRQEKRRLFNVAEEELEQICHILDRPFKGVRCP